MRRFFDKYKSVIVWVMVAGFFLGAAVFAAFRYVGPSPDDQNSSQDTEKAALIVNGEKITERNQSNFTASSVGISHNSWKELRES